MATEEFMERRNRWIAEKWDLEEIACISSVGEKLIRLTTARRSVLADVQQLMQTMEDKEMLSDAVNWRDALSGATVLHYASIKEELELGLIQLFLEEKADINLVNKNKSTALHLASRAGHQEVVELLLNNKCDVTLLDKLRRTALQVASRVGHVEVVKLLLKENCALDSFDHQTLTALHLASKKGHYKVVKLLIDAKCDMYSRDNHKSTPAHMAASRGHEKVVACFMDNAFDINVVDEYNQTLLHLASRNGHLSVVNRLLLHESCICLDWEDNFGRTALYLSARNLSAEERKKIQNDGGFVEKTREALMLNGAQFTLAHLSTGKKNS